MLTSELVRMILQIQTICDKVDSQKGNSPEHMLKFLN